MEEKPIPEIKDLEETQMIEKAEKSIKQQEIKEEIKEEIKPVDTPVWDSVPPELPKAIFHVAAKAIECPKMELDARETEYLTRHFSNLLGNPSSKIFSLVVVIVVIASKVVDCKQAIMKKMGKKQES